MTVGRKKRTKIKMSIFPDLAPPIAKILIDCIYELFTFIEKNGSAANKWGDNFYAKMITFTQK